MRTRRLPPVLLLLGVLLLPGGAGAAPPPFVLVHGAWHGARAWYRVRALLEAAGHPVTVPHLPSHGIDRAAPAGVTLDDYARPSSLR
jgi:pimeloyl-ACP methyl ester carboxylesterase